MVRTSVQPSNEAASIVFGTRIRPRRPILLMLVFGAFLAIIGITASAQSVLVGTHFSTSTLNDIVGSDAATVRAFVNAYVRPADFAPTGPDPSSLPRLESQLATLVRPGEIVRVELRRPDGTIVAADDPALRGTSVVTDDAFVAATRGEAQASIGPATEAAAGPGDLGSPTLLREYLPLEVDGRVQGVVAIWRDARPILERLETVRREVVLLTLSASLVAAALLFLIFRSAQARLTRQTSALVEATRRDPLTGTLNHGALVDQLAHAIEASRVTGLPLAIALIDIDNFRLLNDNHGHTAGDEALLAVARIVDAQIDPSMEMGRYGPDEFLVVAPTADIAGLEPAITRVGTALVDLSLRFAETERLPVTVSVGIAMFPEHASSVTALLATAAQALGEAKAGGGDAVRIAGPVSADDAAAASTFDVLQGLVLAVDAKDRYTKRHSDDVARYATFLAGRIGRPAEEIRTIGLAGLLHDVGKIGIPDHILRKPGRLTEAEYQAVQQHVALGDMIVRDLPDIDAVRAGVRHHHERWDGDGYLDHLAGEEIPLIARILAVADAFSAMTTTRPYRKAFDVREALIRLGDAAGTQLDEGLVMAFIEGIEHDAAPPLPGDGTVTRLWLPGRRVA